MAKVGFFFYTGDWVKDTRVLTAEQRGCWADSLVFLHENGGSVTWPIEAYANYWGMSVESARCVLDAIAIAKVGNVSWQSDGKTIANLSNRRMVREAQKRLETKEKRSKAGKIGAANRWQKCDSSYSSSYSSSSSNLKEEEKSTELSFDDGRKLLKGRSEKLQTSLRCLKQTAYKTAHHGKELALVLNVALEQQEAWANTFDAIHAEHHPYKEIEDVAKYAKDKVVSMEDFRSKYPQLLKDCRHEHDREKWPEEDRWLSDLIAEQQFLDNEFQCPLQNHGWWEDTSRALGGVNPAFLERELAKMSAWWRENPGKRKTPKGICRFVRNWLERAQNEKGQRYANQNGRR